MVRLSDRYPVNGWWAYWSLTTAGATVAATFIDAVLLQRKWNYFTGGFLAVDHIQNAWQAAGFFIGSLLCDVAILSILIAAVLWVAVLLRLSPRWAVAVTIVASLGPLLVAEFVNYRLLSFLGDSFDFRLMFDLSGRDIWESLAVSSSHLSGIAWAGTAASPFFLWACFVAMRKASQRIWAKTVGFVNPHGRKTLVACGMLYVVASVALVVLRGSSDAVDNGLKRKPTVIVLSLTISWLSDVDGDGFGVLGRVPDTAPFDATIRPYALDIPGNGIDEDGVGGDLVEESEPHDSEAVPAAQGLVKPNIVLVMLEGVRADIVGSSIDGQAVTPVLDRLAASGVSVRAAYSHNGYTVQSRHAIFSGSIFGARGSTTLVDDLKAQGYEVGYFSGQDESFGGPDGDVGFERADVAFDARSAVSRRYSSSTSAGSLAIPMNVVLERVGAFLAGRSKDKPLFLYVNFHDTHFPYHHAEIEPILRSPVLSQAEIQPDRADELRLMYANTVANTDRAIGRLLEQVRASLGSPPGVIVVSDHGESIFDEGALGHGYVLNDAQTRIPLIASDLAVVLREPFAQSDLRAAINDAIGRSAGDSSPRPAVVPDPSRQVFQYLGVFEGPAQIALVGRGERVFYDFRSRRFRAQSGPWTRLAGLSESDEVRFLGLIRTWERLNLAKAGQSTTRPAVRSDSH